MRKYIYIPFSALRCYSEGVFPYYNTLVQESHEANNAFISWSKDYLMDRHGFSYEKLCDPETEYSINRAANHIQVSYIGVKNA